MPVNLRDSRPAEAGGLTLVDGYRAGGRVLVQPDGVLGGGQAGIDRRVTGARGGPALPHQGVRPATPAPEVAGRTDFDLVTASLRRRVHDEGADTCTQVEDHAARARRAGRTDSVVVGHHDGVSKPLYGTPR